MKLYLILVLTVCLAACEEVIDQIEDFNFTNTIEDSSGSYPVRSAYIGDHGLSYFRQVADGPYFYEEQCQPAEVATHRSWFLSLGTSEEGALPYHGVDFDISKDRTSDSDNIDGTYEVVARGHEDSFAEATYLSFQPGWDSTGSSFTYELTGELSIAETADGIYEIIYSLESADGRKMEGNYKGTLVSESLCD